MTSSASRIENGRLTLSDLQTVRFQESQGFGRGYDEAEVDAFIARCASEFQRLTKRVDELEAQASTLATKGATDGYIATQSATILSVAQQTADVTVKNADEYSVRVMTEARTMYSPLRQSTRQTSGTKRSSGRRSTYAPYATRRRCKLRPSYRACSTM
jgi:DivIVA domain-containing protein